MKKSCVLAFAILALFCGAAPLAGALDIDGNFLLGNLGFTSSDTTFSGWDYFWGGSLSVRDDLSSNVRIEAALTRDMVTGNSISAMFQYRTSWLRVGMGPWIGFLNSSSAGLKSGISALIGVEVPGAVFASLRTDSSLGGQTSVGDYAAQSNQFLFGFYAGDFAICTIGLLFEEFDSVTSLSVLTDTLKEYSFDVKVFEKNVPYRLDFSVAYQSHGLDSVIAGTGIDLIFSPEFTLTLAFRASLWTGTGVPSGVSFSPFLFQGAAGFRISLPDEAASTGTP